MSERGPRVATLDAELQRSVRRASVMRQGFYVVVLLVALAGQVSGAVEALGIPLAAAIPAVAALELGGIVVLANADVRRRLGERAIGSRLLSAAIAAGAVAFNWLAHADHLLGGFFAGMSALGYLVWLTHTENQRRDRLRATGDLPPTTPAYEVFGHWLRHPLLTSRAKSLAKADPGLGLYGSISAAQAGIRRDRRRRAIAKVLHRKIRAAVDPRTADIALAVYDLEEIASRLADRADYDGLTALIAADLAPARLAPEQAALGDEQAAVSRQRSAVTAEGAALALEQAAGDTPAQVTPPVTPPVMPAEEATQATAPSTQAQPAAAQTQPAAAEIAVPAAALPARAEPVAAAAPAAPPAALTETTDQFRVLAAVRRELEELQAGPARASAQRTDADAPASSRRRSRAASTATTGRAAVPAPSSVRTPPSVRTPAPARASGPAPAPARAEDGTESERTSVRRDRSLRSRVHAALDRHAPADGRSDSTQLVDLVADVLQLDDVERMSAASYVQTWQRDAGTPLPHQRGVVTDQGQRL